MRSYLWLGLATLLGCDTPSPPAGPADEDRLQQTLARALAGIVPMTGHQGWEIDGGVDGSFVRHASATFRALDETFLRITVRDLEGAAVAGAAGELIHPTLPAEGFKERRDADGHRVLYRLNPPGGHFGGELRIFLDDRFVVTAVGSRLTMESISDHAHRVARALSTL
jgi:hypothetical protein